MDRVMLMYPPGDLYQRSEDRAQCNVEYSSAVSIHACNDLGYCAAVLKRGGYEVFLQDYEMERSLLSEVVKDMLFFQPDLLFMSTTNATITDDLKIIAYLKQFHACKVVLKGALFYDADLALLEQLDLSDADCLVGGEVEFVINKIADALLRNKGELSAIPGILYREGDGWKKTAFGCWNDDLDSLPFPDRTLMHNELYVRPDTDEPMATISVSRGCPSRCMYCLTPFISGKKARIRSVENVMAELEECYHRFGIKHFFFKADTFTINKKWVIKLCDAIIASDLGGKITFTANARADTVSPDLLQKMKQAGCFTIGMGFESGSEKTLRLIGKHITAEQNVKAARMLQAAGIPIFGFFMIGFPWETEEDMNETVKHIFEINPDFIEISMAMPYYGTQLFEQCREADLIADSPFGYDYFLMPSTKGTRFTDLETVRRIRKKALKRFYLRPGYIAKKMTGALKEPVIVKNYVKYGLKLLKNLKK